MLPTDPRYALALADECGRRRREETAARRLLAASSDRSPLQTLCRRFADRRCAAQPVQRLA